MSKALIMRARGGRLQEDVIKKKQVEILDDLVVGMNSINTNQIKGEITGQKIKEIKIIDGSKNSCNRDDDLQIN